jgi:DNA invertase Pin-like site-specific DNA recombinase
MGFAMDTSYLREDLQAAIGYGRVSTYGQWEPGNPPLLNQFDKANQLLSANGLKMCQWLTEVGPSVAASSHERPVLIEAVEQAYMQDRPLVVSDLSRISRDVDVIKSIVVDLGIEIIDAKFGGTLSPQLAIKITERNRKSFERRKERAREGVLAAQSSGKRAGNPGIREAQKIACAIRSERAAKFYGNMYSVFKQVVPEIIFENMGRVNFTKLAARLNEKGIYTRLGRRWSAASVRAVAIKVLQLKDRK